MRIQNISNNQTNDKTNFKALKVIKFGDKFKWSPRAQKTLSDTCRYSEPFREFCKQFHTYVFFSMFKGDNNLMSPRMNVYYDEIPEKPLTNWQMFKKLAQKTPCIEIIATDSSTVEEGAEKLAKCIIETEPRFTEEVETSKRIKERRNNNK